MSQVPANSVVCLRRSVPQTLVDSYAAVSGDHNPIHVDPDFAAQTEFGRTIVHGQLLLVLAAEALSGRWGAEWDRSGLIEIRFVRPAFVGESAEIRLAELPSDAAGFGRVTVDVVVGDVVVATGTAACRLVRS